MIFKTSKPFLTKLAIWSIFVLGIILFFIGIFYINLIGYFLGVILIYAAMGLYKIEFYDRD